MIDLKTKRLLIQKERSCIACGSTKRLSIDHIISRANGGSDAVTNLQVLCKLCNSRKGYKNIDFKNGVPQWFESGLSPRCLKCQLRAIRFDKLCATCYSFTNKGKNWDGKPQLYRTMVYGVVRYGTLKELANKPKP